MKNYIDSDYAANKNAAGIVYRFANETVEITLEAYLAENPGKTEADFAEWKALSDRDYFEQDRSDCRQTWKNVSLHGLGELADCAAPSPEDAVISKLEQAAMQKRRYALARQALDKLTEVQRRRYLQYHAQGMTEEQIATREGASQQAISKSLILSEKKIKKFLAEAEKQVVKPLLFSR